MSLMPNTIRDFYEWVKTRDPEETYNYYSMENCARARYCKSRGLSYGNNDCMDEHPIEAASMQENIPGANPNKLTMANLRKEIEENWL